MGQETRCSSILKNDTSQTTGKDIKTAMIKKDMSILSTTCADSVYSAEERGAQSLLD